MILGLNGDMDEPSSPLIRVTDSPNTENSGDNETSNSSPVPNVSLFQPFLPANTNNEHRSPLPFSIDNILKPTFGQRLFLHTMAAAAAAAAAALQQQALQPAPGPVRHNAHRKANRRNNHNINNNNINNNNNNNNINNNINNNNNNGNNNSNMNTNSNNGNGNGSNNVSVGAASPVDLSSGLSSCSSESTSKKDESLPPGMVRGPNGQLWPAWVFCTRYSDRPSSGPRLRKVKKSPGSVPATATSPDDKNKDKRPRTNFSSEQLNRLRHEFETNRYLNEERRKNLADELGLNENQIKIWFQNKRAKIKKSTGKKGELAQMLAAQGLYNHSTVPVDEDENPLLCP